MMQQDKMLNGKPEFTELALGCVKPEGWLLQQLKLQADGLTGHLDEVWPDVGANSGWLGGDGEDWERGPYYLDGLLPLAYLLDDPYIKNKVQKWVEWSLQSQENDGFFGPKSNCEWWPRMVMLKVMMQYYSATNDERVLPFMDRYFRYQAANLQSRPLSMWGVPRAAENILAVYWLYEKTGEAYLTKLAELLFEQSYDWVKFYEKFPFKTSMSEYMPWKEFRAVFKSQPMDFDQEEKNPLYSSYHASHVVNVAMGLKYAAMKFMQTGDKAYAENVKKGFEQLMKYHGVAYGLFTGDEHLNGTNPTQGTELCAVVETMFSFEVLTRTFGTVWTCDNLEKLAYNMLPAAIKSDYWGRQYDQQANQVMCSETERRWYNNGNKANLFGLEPNFGCCTANMHQGMPKFVASMWAGTSDGGLVAVAYGPNRFSGRIGGKRVELEQQTDYPFSGEIDIRFSLPDGEAEFPLYLRVPGWAAGTGISINSRACEQIQEGSFHRIMQTWSTGDAIHISMPMKARITQWYKRSVSVEVGSLLFSLGITEVWKRTGEGESLADWSVLPASKWNFALGLNGEGNLQSAEYIYKKMPIQPFESFDSPIELKVKGKEIDQWKLDGAQAGDLPQSPVMANGKSQELTLVPYGAAKLRITQFPCYLEE
jgi:DUF1680 family protein